MMINVAIMYPGNLIIRFITDKSNFNTFKNIDHLKKFPFF